MLSSIKFWTRLAIWNILIVAILGMVMRYKILFSLEWLDQKSLMHAHSHFAFAGWVSLSLMVLMVYSLGITRLTPVYKRILITHSIAAYGMLFSFPFQGYGGFSIFFSTLSVIVSYFFSWYCWQDCKHHVAARWFRGALIFLVLSSVGPFSLGYFMTHPTDQQYILASIYYYLHFQYNGWFFFACMGLAVHALAERNVQLLSSNTVFNLFSVACVPTCFLSITWMTVPVWAYVAVIFAAGMQLFAWMLFCRELVRYPVVFGPLPKWLFILSAIGVTIKVVLQALSAIPSLSSVVYGYRPIVIGYLHLVLLVIITLCIIGYMITNELVSLTATGIAGIILFVSGVFLNELLLMIQGITALGYIHLGYVNELLFVIAFIMVAGLLFLNLGQYFITTKKYNYDKRHHA